MSEPVRVLTVGDAAVPWLPPAWTAQHCASLADASVALGGQAFDALLIRLGPRQPPAALLQWQALSQAALDAAVVVVVDDGEALRQAPALVERGVQDVLPAAGADAGGLPRALELALLRKRLERSARKAYAIDLATGLPNDLQLREHMTHLLALREREPAPMALLVLRVEGLAAAAATLGPEAANVLRRKAAVRLRAGLRASDVVAAIGADSFAVLLAWIDAPGDAARVADKLALSLRRPFNVAGHEQRLAVAAGVADYPLHGRVADDLLRLALGQCAAAPATTAGGGGAHAGAANDE